MADKRTPDAEDDFSIDYDVSTLDDKGKQLYESLNKQFRDAYLKKTTSLADSRKGMEKQLSDAQAKIKDIEARYQEAESERQQFRDWWQREGQFMYNTPEAAAKAEGFDTPRESAQELQGLRNEMIRAQQSIESAIKGVNDRMGQYEQALRLQHDLFDLRFKHPQADPMKVLETAKEKNITNLDLAYNLAYGDEIMKGKEEELRKEYDTRLQEELSKKEAEAKIVETSPKTTRYATPEKPSSYGEASQSLLGVVRGSGGTLTD